MGQDTQSAVGAHEGKGLTLDIYSFPIDAREDKNGVPVFCCVDGVLNALKTLTRSYPQHSVFVS